MWKSADKLLEDVLWREKAHLKESKPCVTYAFQDNSEKVKCCLIKGKWNVQNTEKFPTKLRLSLSCKYSPWFRIELTYISLCAKLISCFCFYMNYLNILYPPMCKIL